MNSLELVQQDLTRKWCHDIACQVAMPTCWAISGSEIAEYEPLTFIALTIQRGDNMQNGESSLLEMHCLVWEL